MRPGSLRVCAGFVLACCSATALAAPALPWAGDHKHLGAATCGGGNCHAAARPTANSPVRQDEYFTWERKDAHSNAYKLLLGDAGRRIATNLGLKAAHEAPECLTCHADYVPERLRATRYQLGDGIACEGCHGGAEAWNKQHTAPGATHASNVAAGLYPLEDPGQRARVCLHCHLGSDEKPIDHRIMGAGHPPLSFELDTFTAIQPGHFDVDADYRKRKDYAGNLRTWAVGQAVATQFFLDGVIGGRFQQRGTFPELVFFDCNACHHATRPERWSRDTATGVGPGEPRLADAALVMTGAVLAVLRPDLAGEWDRALAGLHAGARASVAQAKDGAARLRRLAQEAEAAAARPLARKEALALFERVLEIGERKGAADCTTAEQVVYALGALGETLKAEGAPVRGFDAPYNAAVDSVNCRRGAFEVKAFRDSLRKLREATRKGA